ncbi:hypothetical protein JAAARDRAFT_194359 [Jaapia argillacea MUCL 33604]|uniref:Uncharacterized protein n=1 Tax=Jaapia argillacea MUCL 33604 TaxID=933084 RepID=A0A067Q3M2_9AGAM|nr:hypothetical protein JAAARDRAFT_194359 [Jaapia argillacea MUCL 33604]
MADTDVVREPELNQELLGQEETNGHLNGHGEVVDVVADVSLEDGDVASILRLKALNNGAAVELSGVKGEKVEEVLADAPSDFQVNGHVGNVDASAPIINVTADKLDSELAEFDSVVVPMKNGTELEDVSHDTPIEVPQAKDASIAVESVPEVVEEPIASIIEETMVPDEVNGVEAADTPIVDSTTKLDTFDEPTLPVSVEETEPTAVAEPLMATHTPTETNASPDASTSLGQEPTVEPMVVAEGNEAEPFGTESLVVVDTPLAEAPTISEAAVTEIDPSPETTTEDVSLIETPPISEEAITIIQEAPSKVDEEVALAEPTAPIEEVAAVEDSSQGPVADELSAAEPLPTIEGGSAVAEVVEKVKVADEVSAAIQDVVPAAEEVASTQEVSAVEPDAVREQQLGEDVPIATEATTVHEVPVVEAAPVAEESVVEELPPVEPSAVQQVPEVEGVLVAGEATVDDEANLVEEIAVEEVPTLDEAPPTLESSSSEAPLVIPEVLAIAAEEPQSVEPATVEEVPALDEPPVVEDIIDVAPPVDPTLAISEAALAPMELERVETDSVAAVADSPVVVENPPTGEVAFLEEDIAPEETPAVEQDAVVEAPAIEEVIAIVEETEPVKEAPTEDAVPVVEETTIPAIEAVVPPSEEAPVTAITVPEEVTPVGEVPSVAVPSALEDTPLPDGEGVEHVSSFEEVPAVVDTSALVEVSAVPVAEEEPAAEDILSLEAVPVTAAAVDGSEALADVPAVEDVSGGDEIVNASVAEETPRVDEATLDLVSSSDIEVSPVVVEEVVGSPSAPVVNAPETLLDAALLADPEIISTGEAPTAGESLPVPQPPPSNPEPIPAAALTTVKEVNPAAETETLPPVDPSAQSAHLPSVPSVEEEIIGATAALVPAVLALSQPGTEEQPLEQIELGGTLHVDTLSLAVHISQTEVPAMPSDPPPEPQSEVPTIQLDIPEDELDLQPVESATTGDSTLEIERPRSPWTPSYSVIIQGGSTSDGVEEEIAELEQLPPAVTDITSDLPVVEIPEPAIVEASTAEMPTVEVAVSSEPISPPVDELPPLQTSALIPADESQEDRPKSPWTPSYSVTTIGHGLSDVEEDTKDREDDDPDAIPHPVTEEVPETAHTRETYDAGVSELHDEASPTEEPEEDHAVGGVAIVEEMHIESFSLGNPVSEEPTTVQLAVSTPIHDVSLLQADAETVQAETSIESMSQLSVEINTEIDGPEDAVEWQPVADADSSSTSEALTPDRPRSPWIPSYSVTRSPQVQSLDIEEESVDETHMPESKHVEETLPVPDPATPERPKSPWTPSYSVTMQGPGQVAEEETEPATGERLPEPVSSSEQEASFSELSTIPSITTQMVSSDRPEDELEEVSDVPEVPGSPRSSLGMSTPSFDSRSEVSEASHEPVPAVSPRLDPSAAISEAPPTQDVDEADTSASTPSTALPDIPALSLRGQEEELTAESLGTIPDLASIADSSVRPASPPTIPDISVAAESAPSLLAPEATKDGPVELSLDDANSTLATTAAALGMGPQTFPRAEKKPSLLHLAPIDEDGGVDLSASNILESTSPSTARARQESTTSSRFFPGGWFSSSPKLPHEGRTSFDVAAGEFSPVPPLTQPTTGQVEDTAEFIDDHAEHSNGDDEKHKGKKGKWCVIM